MTLNTFALETSAWLAHVRADVTQRLRSPAYLFGLIAFPSLFYVFFGEPYVHGTAEANVTMVSYAAFSVLAVALLQVGVSTGVNRTQRWEVFLRYLPGSEVTRVLARVTEAVIFATFSASVVVVIAILATPVSLAPLWWMLLCSTLLLGSVPFAFLGLAVGYWINPRGAGAAGNLIYFPLAFIGLTSRPLPGVLSSVGVYTPTRQWAYILWGEAGGFRVSRAHVVWLLVYGAVFAVLAWSGYRRDRADVTV